MDYSDFFEDKLVLVTGGTGTIGSEIVNQLLRYNPKTIRILSNSENELWESRLRFKDQSHKLRFLLGDIRDYERIKKAANNIDYIFNAAAIKHVPISEYNPMEAINVNILGLENIIDAAFSCSVKKLIHISTDKAVNPTTTMGATKMLGERLCVSRELTKGTNKTNISCVRFGNVLGSRGSIIPLIKNQIKNENFVTLTEENMRRFFLSIPQAIELVIKSAVTTKGGEICVLKMPVVKIKDMIEVVIEEYSEKVGKDPNSIKIKIVGPRPGEKIDEELISPIEYSSCYETEDMFIIYPYHLMDFGYDTYDEIIPYAGTKVSEKDQFQYSTKNVPPLSKDELRAFLKELNLI